MIAAAAEMHLNAMNSEGSRSLQNKDNPPHNDCLFYPLP